MHVQLLALKTTHAVHRIPLGPTPHQRPRARLPQRAAALPRLVQLFTPALDRPQPSLARLHLLQVAVAAAAASRLLAGS